MKTTVAVLTTLLGAAIGVHAQSLLTNGSFEALGPGTTLQPGNTNIFGWAIGGTGSLYLARAPVPGWSFVAAHGQQWVDLNGAGVTLSQSFPTAVGETYEARFTVGRFQGSFAMRLQAAILTDSGNIVTNTEAVVPVIAGWNSPTLFRFVAVTPRTTIQFTDTTGTVNYDLTLDDVSVERVTPHLSIECSQVRICWESQTNRSYQLQYQSALTTNIWTDSGVPVPGTGATDCTEQPISEPRRFYRVVRLP